MNQFAEYTGVKEGTTESRTLYFNHGRMFDIVTDGGTGCIFKYKTFGKAVDTWTVTASYATVVAAAAGYESGSKIPFTFIKKNNLPNTATEAIDVDSVVYVKDNNAIIASSSIFYVDKGIDGLRDEWVINRAYATVLTDLNASGGAGMGCTLAQLQAGTVSSAFVTPKVLADQGIQFPAELGLSLYATPLALAMTAYTIAGTGGRNHPLIGIGSWDKQKSVTLVNDHFVPIQTNIINKGNVTFDLAAARLRVDSDTATTGAIGNLQLRQLLSANLGSSAILNASVNVSGTVTVGTGSLLGGYFSIEGSGAIVKAGSNDCTVLVAVNNNTGATTVDNVALFMQNGTGTTITEIVKVINNVGTATAGINIARSAGTLTNGLLISGATTTAISITGGCATGVSIVSTLSAASSKAITSRCSISNGNLTDGVGANEFDLTLTGTVAGSVAASSSWINAISVTAGANLICAQTNGIYAEAGGLLASSTLIFGMRAQCLVQAAGSAPAESYPFSIVNNTTITTAIIQCNDSSSDLGRVTNAGTDDGTLVPLYKDNTGIKYVKIYSLV